MSHSTATAARTVTMKGGEVFRAVISLADLKIALADGFASFVAHTVREDGIVDALVRNGNFDGAGRGRFLMSARTARQLGALATPVG